MSASTPSAHGAAVAYRTLDRITKFQFLKACEQLQGYRDRNQCPVNDKLCEQAVWFGQTTLLGETKDMDNIVRAIRKIQKHASRLATGQQEDRLATIARRTILAFAGTAFLPSQSAAAPSNRPRLGVVVDMHSPNLVDPAMARVRDFGLSCCQPHVGEMPSLDLAEPIRAAARKYQIEVTAASTLGPGKVDWDFYGGPGTCGLVPRALRSERVRALKLASDLAHACGIPAIHTHCGYIPEDPNSDLYKESVEAIHEVASHAGANGQIFLMETGQETPVTLLRAILDTGLDNVKVNLDVANLILYGKGEPVGALDVIGPYVRGLHAKDGLYPTGPRQLGQEVPIGKGRVNFPEVMRKLKQLKYAGPITIEREINGPQQASDIRESKLFLQALIDRSYAE